MTETQVRYASTIRASGQDLLKLLNSILDLAKVESGTTTVEITRVGLAQLQSDLLRDFEHVASEKGLSYSVDLAPASPASIDSDPHRLGQILKNLISNAFKFTESGGVQVRIAPAVAGWSPEAERLASARSVVAISIRDSGVGVELEQQQRVFEAFAQGDGTTARLYGGTGLGLSISRALVALLGGDITLASAPGDGSTFTVYLPADLAATSASTPDASSPASAPALGAGKASLVVGARWPQGLDGHPFSGKRVLVVDDDFRNVFALSALLERGQAQVFVAESGPEALAELERTPTIDLVLMDIMMPIMDGYAAMRAIRAQDRFATLPMIAVTGKVVAGERQRCLDAGANDYVAKPVDTVQLLAAIGPWLCIAPQTTA